MLPPSLLRLCGAPVPLLLGLTLLAATASAQEPCPPDVVICDGTDVTPPTITITPNGGSYLASALSVSIDYWDAVGLNGGSRAIVLNGSNVTSSFTFFSNHPTTANSSGTIALVPGSNTFTVSICDTSSNCGSRSVTYNYTPDTTAPTVTITPSGGTYTSPSLSVTISWADNLSLNAASRQITLNGTTVTSSFNYSGSATSAQSSGTITLQPGSNLLRARIQDSAGNWSAWREATYTYTPPAPSVSISPNGGTYASSSRSVTIDWADNLGLDPGSRLITLNGVNVTSSFSYNGPTTLDPPHQSAKSAGTVTLQAGSNTLSARICNIASTCTTQSTTYVFDGTAPTVTLNPTGGTYTSASLSVTINWADNLSLNAGSRSVTLNGSNVTAAFSYAGSATSTQSSGTITLQAGSNTLSARICDTAGNCTTTNATYTFDGTAPTVALNPTGGSYTSNSLEVTITWTDNLGLNASSRQITLNGTGVTASFSYTGSATSAQSVGSITLQAGSNTLTARIQDSAGNWSATQTASYTYNAPPPGEHPPQVEVASVNAGTSISRHLCLSIAAGPDAAYECADLRVIHPLPAVRTMNQVRAPVLLYNSQHGAPRPLLAAHVTRPAGANQPDSVVARILIGGTQQARGRWSGASWPATGSTRRITLDFSATSTSTWATGVYTYTLEIANWYGATPKPTSVSGQLVIVNRRGSEFGAGWWLAGLERLHFPAADTTQRLWVGGDGSTRLYRKQPVCASGWICWAAESVERPDTLKWDLQTSRYVRFVPQGRLVRFNAAGQHIETENRLGHRTLFSYESGRLSRISLPAPSGSGPYYEFTYSNNKLSSISSPGQGSRRITTLWHNGTRVDSIQDPDGTKVRFAYAGSSDHRITYRTDRRGTVNRFRYDAGANRLSRVQIDHTGLNLSTYFTPAETRALASSSASVTALDPAEVFTLLDGPRTDVSDHNRFWLDRFGAPTKIRDALGHETVLTRGHSDFPALVTAVVRPNGYRTVATYNSRGNILSSTQVNPYGTGVDATTRYEWGTSGILVDFVHRIVPPERDSTVIHYFANGNRQWQQDRRGSSSRVHFNYSHPQHLLSSVVLPGGARDSLTYDAAGNLATSRTPRGFLSTYHKDALGRDTLVVSPVDSLQTDSLHQRQRFGYDPMDRLRWTETLGAAMNSTVAQTLRVETAYDAEGNPWKVTRILTPADGISPLVTTTVYDAAGRPVKVVASDLAADSTVYDPAGNPTRVITRRGHEITMAYDAANRLTHRRLPAVLVPQWSHAGIPVSLANHSGLPAAFKGPYPLYGSGGGYLIPADTAIFTYDAVGNLRTANNRDARISRTYYQNGLVRTDTQRIRTLQELSAGGNFTDHVYALTYTYDRNGRRTELQHPANLAPRVSGVIKDKTRYEYHSFGELSKITDVLGHVYRYAYTPRTELDSLYLPRGVSEHYGYDLDGNLATHVVRNGSGGLVRSLTMRYDGRGRMVRSLGTPDTLTVQHSGLGYLVRSSLVTHGVNQVGGAIRYAAHETFTNDALGNLRTTVTRDTTKVGSSSQITNRQRGLRYAGSTARLRASESLSGTHVRDTTWYDPAGNLTFTFQSAFAPSAPLEDRASFYDAEGRLRAADQRRYEQYQSAIAPYRASFEEYRYDAFGRRIWVRARRLCERYQDEWVMLECRQHPVRRTVWDGERELWEIQMPGADGSPYLENDTVIVNLPRTPELRDPHPFYGRVVYTHGLQLDQPVGITRLGYVDFKYGTARTVLPPFTVVPTWSLRGDPDRQYLAETSVATCTGSTTPCAYVESHLRWWAYGAPARLMEHWYGTLIEHKADKTGTFYRRNRYYDAATGRFTQEDPVGLAGGLNLYGYAGGDPINFSDPFGLCRLPGNACRDFINAYIGRKIHAAKDAAIEVGTKIGQCMAATGIAVASGVSDFTGGVALKTVVKAGLRGWAAGQTARALARDEIVRDLAPAAIAESNAAISTAVGTATRAGAEDVGTSAVLNTGSHAMGSDVGLSDWIPVLASANAIQTARDRCAN